MTTLWICIEWNFTHFTEASTPSTIHAYQARSFFKQIKKNETEFNAMKEFKPLPMFIYHAYCCFWQTLLQFLICAAYTHTQICYFCVLSNGIVNWFAHLNAWRDFHSRSVKEETLLVIQFSSSYCCCSACDMHCIYFNEHVNEVKFV